MSGEWIAPVTRVFFHSWGSLGQVFLTAVLAYVALVVLLRFSGKRTLSKMNSFDLVVTVALGSSLATVILSREVPFADGITAFVALVLLQMGVTWCSVRSQKLNHFVKSEPSLVFHQGEFLHKAMRQERVTEDEILAAIRGNGLSKTEEVESVILESNGELSVTFRPGIGEYTEKKRA